MHVWSVSYFVGWLTWSGRLNENADLGDWITPEVLGAYVDDMRAVGLSPKTMATRADGVRAAFSALSPDTPTPWLMGGINQLRAEPSDRRRTQAELVSRSCRLPVLKRRPRRVTPRLLKWLAMALTPRGCPSMPRHRSKTRDEMDLVRSYFADLITAALKDSP